MRLISKKWLDKIYLLCLYLLLTMNPQLHRGRCWSIVCTPSGESLNCKNVCIYGSVRNLLPSKPVLVGTPGITVVHWTLSGSTGFTLELYLQQGINLYLSTTNSAAPHPMTGGTCVCLYVLLLVNKSYYWLLWMEGKNKCAL